MWRAYLFFTTIAIILFSACKNEQKTLSLPLFEVIPAESSQLTFRNNLRESPSQNVLSYEYYYNGAGVAVGDLNGDEWPDLFFVSNIEPNACYLNQGDLTFQDISVPSGLRGKKGFYTGVVMVDINHDGLLDLYVCKSGRFTNPAFRRNELYLNQGVNTDGVPLFEERAKEFGLDLAAYSTQASFVDYDKDGDLDLFLINHGIDTYAQEDIPQLKTEQDGLSGVMLFQNREDYFYEVTEEAGLENNRLGFGLGLAIGDLNNDGWPDAYVSMDYAGKDHLYINQQDGTFRECIRTLTGHTSFYSMGNDMGDINNDGWMDIVNLDMVAADNYGVKTSMSAMNPAQFHQLVEEGQHHQYMYNTLLLNNGTLHRRALPQFSDVGQMSGISSTDWSWAPLLFDFDNDGQKDLFITNGIKRNIRNNDAVKAVNAMRSLSTSGKKVEPSLVKQMLDAFPYHRKPNFFFKNEGELSFQDIGKKLGMDTLPTASNGAAYADLDRDGDLDLIINNVDQPATILRNNSQEMGRSHFLQLIAEGPEHNPQGIGLRVKAVVGKKQYLNSLYTSRGYLSSVEPLMQFGVGEAKLIDSLIIQWPDDKRQILTQVNTNQRLTVSYNEAQLPIQKAFTAPLSPVLKEQKGWSVDEIVHQENEFDDFGRESLLPHKMSQMGPALAVGDVNGDEREDFFMGGAQGFPSRIFLQGADGKFEQAKQGIWEQEKAFEDVVAAFSDVDQDGDLDLWIGSGGNEKAPGSAAYALRLYENDGKGIFRRKRKNIPLIKESVGVLAIGDWDQDGDEDLFVGGRQLPGAYPLPANSYLLINEGNGKFVDATERVQPEFKQLGMVTDATWADIDGDGKKDLMVVGEWMAPRIYINDGQQLISPAHETGLEEQIGWWFGLASADVDQDGDMDFIAGNLGLNYKYKASKNEPFEVHARDFDENGSMDIVLGFHDGKQTYPLRGRECSSNQMPFIKTKFPSYDAFGRASLQEVYGDKGLDQSHSYKATTFASSYFENNGNGSFIVHPLPRMAQLSSVNSLVAKDFDGDGVVDLLLGGNLYGAEVETPRNDASIGLMLSGDGKGNFLPLPPSKSGVQLIGEVKNMLPIRVGSLNAILIGKNQGVVQLLTH